MEDQPNVDKTMNSPQINVIPPSPRRFTQGYESAGKSHANSTQHSQGKGYEGYKESSEINDGKNNADSLNESTTPDAGRKSDSRRVLRKPVRAQSIDVEDVEDPESSHPPRQPIDANIVLNSVTGETDEREPFEAEQENLERHGKGEDVSEKSAEQSFQMNNSVDFSETALEEIAQSMQPFKIKDPTDSLHGLDDVLESDDVVVGFNTSVDKEIICSEEMLSRESTDNKENSSADKSNEAPTAAKGGSRLSHLWKRRSNNQNLEQLVMPNRQNKLNSKNGGVGNDENHTPTNTSTKVEYRVSNETLTVADEDKQRANSNSSLGSAEALNKDALDTAQTPAPGSAMSFTHAAGALNALRKMVTRKEQNNNEGDDPNSPQTPSAARRRWKLAFNVSKFENIVRSPQVPERLDESVFYNFSYKPSAQKSRSKLVSVELFFEADK